LIKDGKNDEAIAKAMLKNKTACIMEGGSCSGAGYG